MTGTHAHALAMRWASRLRDAGIDTARLDAELLIAHVLGIARERILLDDPVLDAAQVGEVDLLLSRRLNDRVPVAYLVGTRWFAGIELAVNPNVLVPRPETELLVELTAQHAPRDAWVRDVGTGSGAIAIALALARPDLRIIASDIDKAAVEVAHGNALRHGVGGAPWEDARPGRIAFEHVPLLGPDWMGEVVVSNPPYVERGDHGQLAPELGHEPYHALYAGDDGLDVIRELVAECGRRAVRLVLIEHGWNQGAAVRELLEGAGYPAPQTAQDLAAHDRVTWARR